MHLTKGVHFIFERFPRCYSMTSCGLLNNNSVMYIQTGSKFPSVQVAIEKLRISIGLQNAVHSDCFSASEN